MTGSGTYETFGCSRGAANPPAAGQAHVLPSRGVVKLRPKFVPSPGEPLSTYHGAVRIPFDREAGPGRLGWYYTTEADFNGLDQGFSRRGADAAGTFVIVEGPSSVIDDD
jgi:hypothetical protein